MIHMNKLLLSIVFYVKRVMCTISHSNNVVYAFAGGLQCRACVCVLPECSLFVRPYRCLGVDVFAAVCVSDCGSEGNPRYIDQQMSASYVLLCCHIAIPLLCGDLCVLAQSFMLSWVQYNILLQVLIGYSENSLSCRFPLILLETLGHLGFYSSTLCLHTHAYAYSCT